MNKLKLSEARSYVFLFEIHIMYHEVGCKQKTILSKKDETKIDLVLFLIINFIINEKNRTTGRIKAKGGSKSAKVNSSKLSLYRNIIKYIASKIGCIIKILFKYNCSSTLNI